MVGKTKAFEEIQEGIGLRTVYVIYFGVELPVSANLPATLMLLSIRSKMSKAKDSTLLSGGL